MQDVPVDEQMQQNCYRDSLWLTIGRSVNKHVDKKQIHTHTQECVIVTTQSLRRIDRVD